VLNQLHGGESFLRS